MADRNDFNKAIIDEFRANKGSVGGGFANVPILLLHHTGAKTGTERVSPLAYQPVGDTYAVFGSMGGSPKHPQWYFNLIANPKTTIEVGEDTADVVARVAEGAERERIWTRQKEAIPTFADYKTKTQGREIPVIVLSRFE